MKANRVFRLALTSGLFVFALLLKTLPATAWGVVGHRYINRLAIEDLPAEMKPLFAANHDWIIQHSIDPDLWREQHRSEGPNHFIDMDTFGVSEAFTYPQEYWTACGLYGKEAIDRNGVVPWRIGQYFGKLVRAFEKKDARAIVETAAWLGHYAADIHVPFHAVANYDGQLTGQKGIHARFESVMVEKQIKFEDLKAVHASHLTNPVGAAFAWARASFRLSSEVLAADKEAVAKDAAYGDAYYASFGAKARAIALRRLNEGAADLASLWYSAWLQAGKPTLPTPTDVHAGELLEAPTHDPDIVGVPAPAEKPTP